MRNVSKHGNVHYKHVTQKLRSYAELKTAHKLLNPLKTPAYISKTFNFNLPQKIVTRI